MLRAIAKPDLPDDSTEDSPAFKVIFGKKTRKYRFLKQFIRLLHDGGNLDFQPTFLFPLITPNGRINGDMATLQNFMCLQYAETLKREGRRADGKSAKYLISIYRQEIKQSIFFSVLKGAASEMYNQGSEGCCEAR